MDRRQFLRLTESLGLTATTLAVAPAVAAEHRRQPGPAPGRDQTTADILVETLIAWGAPFVFGVVGDA